MTKLAAIYDRASREMQKDNWSRKDAKHIGNKLAKQHGFVNVKLFSEVESGESLLDRPVMKEILEMAESGHIGAIIVQNFSRLSRDEDGLDGLTIKKICRDNDVLIIMPGKVYDFSLDQDDKLSDIELMVGRWYKAELMKFTAQGLKARARAGKWMGGTPTFGYKPVWEQENENEKPTADLAIDETEAETVKVMFDLYVNEQLGANGTAKRLSELGSKYRGRKGKTRRFCTGDILRLIQNELYMGFMKWGHAKHGRKSKYLQDFEGTMVHRPELQIVPIKLWEQAQEIRKKRSKAFKYNYGQISQYSFTGICGCIKCGGALSAHMRTNGRNDVKYAQYFCASHSRKDNDCPGYGISERLIANALIPFVAEIINRQIDFGQALNDAVDEYGRTPLEDSIVNETEAEIKKAKEQKKRIIDSIAEGILTKVEATEKLAEVRTKLERLQRKLVDIRRKDEFRQDYLAALEVLTGTDVESVLYEMWKQKPLVLKRILELIFKYASVKIESTGTGTRGGNVKGGHKSWIVSYEFTEVIDGFINEESRSGVRGAPDRADGRRH